MNYYNRFIGDYARDTAHLSLAEHGAYTKLLDHYYGKEQPLPADLDALCRIANAHGDTERAAVAAVIDQFFPPGQDGLRHNGRADEEIEAARRRIETARSNGKRGGRPPRIEGEENPVGSIPLTQRVNSPSTIHHPTTQKLKTPPTPPSVKRSDARTPDEWTADFAALWERYPARTGGNPRNKAWEAYCARRRGGVAHDEMADGLTRYTAWVIHEGKLGTQYVLQGATFFGPAERFRESFSARTPPNGGIGPHKSNGAHGGASDRVSRGKDAAARFLAGDGGVTPPVHGLDPRMEVRTDGE